MTEWLGRFTVRQQAHMLAAPFRVDTDGQAWVCATEGSMLVAVRGGEALPCAEHRAARSAAGWISRRVTLPNAVSYAALREFALPFEERRPCQALRHSCRRCEGTRAVQCDLGEEHDCPDCQDCSCGGTGTITPERRLGFIGDCGIDRALFAPLAHLAPVEVVRVEAGNVEAARPHLFGAEGWLLAIMPLRIAPDSTAPRLTVESLLPAGPGAPKTPGGGLRAGGSA